MTSNKDIINQLQDCIRDLLEFVESHSHHWNSAVAQHPQILAEAARQMLEISPADMKMPVKTPMPPAMAEMGDIIFAEGWNACVEAFFGSVEANDPVIVTVTETLGKEPIGWQIWSGILDKIPHWPPYETRGEAEANAHNIKSVTEVRPLYVGEIQQSAQQQYYYKNDECTAKSSKDPNCKCWWDIGTGPLKDGTPTDFREKPNTTQCELPPYGWICTRPIGHDGPCSAYNAESIIELQTQLENLKKVVDVKMDDIRNVIISAVTKDLK